MTGFISVYITAASAPESEAIARSLVDSKLAACVNIFPNISSIYRWEGKITVSSEFILIAKSCEELFHDIQAKVKAISSYDCPCIVAIPILDGNADYLDWIKHEMEML